MRTISSIEEVDLSAIDRVEADHARQRQEVVDASNVATKRAATLKSGIGVGVAALGIGFGTLLVLFGVSLLTDKPSMAEVSRALSDHASSAMQAMQDQMTARERLAAERHATELATLREAVSMAKAQQVAAEAAANEALALKSKFNAPSASKTVVDFTVFRRRELGSVLVVTGWSYSGVDDAAPTDQWCYIKDTSNPNNLTYQIAVDGREIPFEPSKASRAGVTSNQVRAALSECEWYRGRNSNIVSKG